jgi:carnitine-CoA ligase
VFECAVVAKAHPMLDEVPVAFVLAAPNAPPGLEDLIATACLQQLADFKQPKDIRMVSELPRSTLEKVAKAALRASLKAEAG